MRRTKLIEYTIIVVAAVFGYKFFESLFSLLVQLVAGVSFGADLAAISTPLVIVCGSYLLLFVLLVRKSREIAIYLNGNNAEETISIKIGKKVLLHLIILGICLAAIIEVLPDILIFLYESLKTRKDGSPLDPYSGPVSYLEKGQLTAKIIRLLIAIVVLACSKDLANWFLKHDVKDELVLDAEKDNKDETSNS